MFSIKIGEASCPFGSYNRRVIGALRAADYRTIYTSDGGSGRPGAFLLPRNSVYSHWTLENVVAALSCRMNCACRLGRALRLWIKRWR